MQQQQDASVAAATVLADGLASKVKTMKELRHSDSAKDRETVEAVARLGEEIRRDTRRLIVEHPVYAVANDAHSKLWHAVYYKQIELYRKSIMKHAAELKLPPSESGASEEDLVRSKTHFVKLVASYTKFLSDAMVYFQDVMLQLESEVGQRSLTKPVLECHLKSIQKCLLGLGDLARYKESVSESTDKNYDVSYRYYERAAFLVPNSGNPQNQLAVLATYGQSELVAVYHYCRSVLVEFPFSLGSTNLSTLFVKNERAYAQALRQAAENDAAMTTTTTTTNTMRRQVNGGGKSDIKSKVHFFMLQFIRLHARIFDWAAGKFQLIDTSKTIFAQEISVDEFTTGVHEMLDNFDNILTSLSDALLVRLICICIYSVHESVPPSPSKAEGLEKTLTRNRGPRTTGESLSLVVLYSFISR